MTNKTFAGEANTPSTFHLALAENPELAARWDAVCASVFAHAKAIGVTNLTRQDVESLPSARLAVLAGVPLDGDAYERELNNLPQMAEAKRKAAMAEKVASGDADAQASLERMRPSERMTFARENGLDRKQEQKDLTPDEEASRAAMLATMNPVQRMSLARKWGMTGQE